MGKIIAIDGLDGSGKATQTALLTNHLKNIGVPVRQITFPNYESRSSELVKMYLNGEIFSNPNEINAYAAASFYAADRYISYQTDWARDYKSGTTILCDRYISSNAIHQMVKLEKSQWDEFLDWLYDYECDKLGLPLPNQTIFLDMPPEVSQELLLKRYEGDNTKKDIHENDFKYLLSCRQAALFTADKLGWDIISCAENGYPYDIETISKKIIECIRM